MDDDSKTFEHLLTVAKKEFRRICLQCVAFVGVFVEILFVHSVFCGNVLSPFISDLEAPALTASSPGSVSDWFQDSLFSWVQAAPGLLDCPSRISIKVIYINKSMASRKNVF